MKEKYESSDQLHNYCNIFSNIITGIFSEKMHLIEYIINQLI